MDQDYTVHGLDPQSQALLFEWNRHTPPAVDCCIHDLISQHCKTHPDAPAIHAWDGDLSYRKLDHLSTTLAAHLVRIGVVQEQFVPVCFEKSLWAVVALLAVSKAGGAFLLLDPSHPLRRIQDICRQIHASLILASPTHAPRASQLGDSVVTVDGPFLASLPGSEVVGTLPTQIAFDQPLYAVFTSGSTGRPKGAVVEHRSMSSGATAQVERFSLTWQSRVLQSSSHAFDTCIAEILSTLVAGGCVCIPSEADRMARLAGVIQDLQVNCLLLTPSVARLLSPSDLPRGTTMVLGGEPVAPEDLRVWRGHVQLFNGYGPAETTVYSAAHRVDPDDDDDARNMGCPLGSRAWVVDPSNCQTLLPVGAVGELLIEGPIVSRGYFGQQALTTEKFIPSPSWRRQFPMSLASPRMYRTGDLVQYGVDGGLRYVRRRDLQAKLRGQRLELGEVETHARSQLPHTRQVWAEVMTPSNGAPFLGLFVHVPEPDSTGSSSSSSSILAPPTEQFGKQVQRAVMGMRSQLPTYMVPTAFFPLRRVPLNSNSKADRAELRRQCELLSSVSLEEYSFCSFLHSRSSKRAPVTETEKTLQRIWAEILRLPRDRVGIDDPFFAIGGDSLTAMKMVQQAHAQGLPFLSASRSFSGATLAELAQGQNDHRPGQQQSEPPNLASPCALDDLQLGQAESLVCDNVERILPTTDFQRDWLMAEHKTHFSCWFPEPVDADRLQHACQALVNRHAILRTLFFPHRGEMIQVILSQLEIPLRQYRVQGQSLEDFLQDFCQRDVVTPLPSEEPYFQVSLASSASPAQNQHLFIIRLNHAQFDRLMLDPLLEELGVLYRGEQATAPPAVDYPRYLQYRWAQTTPAAEDFWRNYLQGSCMIPSERLGADNPAMAQNKNSSRSMIMSSGDFPFKAPPPGITTATVIKAAWALVLMRLTQQSDVVFGHHVNGRSVSVPGGLDSVMGPCMNTIPIRHVHDQYAGTIDYEMLEPRHIVSHCTAWPKGTGYGTTVTLEIPEPFQISLDGQPRTVDIRFIPMREEIYQTMEWPVMLMVYPYSSSVNVLLASSSHIMSHRRSDWLLKKFGEAVESLGQVDSALDLSPYPGLVECVPPN
ncbi:hypothetical protein EYZ11_004128 [Aspergillus tanneri]|uniref:Carrier domain-containing protein n=1 Tax=Aspergillus tanneri TaxID=1220188 RepID=A0A4V3UPT5_9EURO|nr:hypothetical protein EYZ11_004128 [Aspergillus tanneri]